MVARKKCPKWVYERRSKTLDWDGIMRESEPFCESGMLPTSIVLRKFREGEYVTHLKIYPNKTGNPYYAHGDYYGDVDDAIESYRERCKKYGVKPQQSWGGVKRD